MRLRAALLVGAALALAGCGSPSDHSSPSGSTAATKASAAGAGAVETVIRGAIDRLNAFDLIGFCRFFAPEALDKVAQLHGATGCDDVRLRTIISSCQGCEKQIEILDLDVDVVGDAATAHLRLRNPPVAPGVVVKDVHLSRRAGVWLLLDTPDAVVP
jgi:uncharacterized protein YceK